MKIVSLLSIFFVRADCGGNQGGPPRTDRMSSFFRQDPSAPVSPTGVITIKTLAAAYITFVSTKRRSSGDKKKELCRTSVSAVGLTISRT
jgi:hypothetical protein